MTPMRTSSRRGTLGTGMAALLAATFVPVVVANAAEPDAELIRQCDLMTAIEKKIDAFHGGHWTDQDDVRFNAELDVLIKQRETLFAEIERPPTTRAGARAIARAYLAVCLKNSRGEPDWDDESGYFALSLAKFIANVEQRA